MNEKTILFVSNDSFDSDYLVKKISIPNVVFRTISTNDNAEELLREQQCIAIIGNFFVKGFSYHKLKNFIFDNKKLENIPILIILTTKEADEDIKTLKDLSDDFIVKPFSIKLLEIKIQQLLKRKNEIDIAEHAVLQIEDKNNKKIYQEKLNIFREISTNIANELKDPINFIKNFSEITISLANALKTSNKKNMNKELYVATLKKIIDNLNITYKYSIKLNIFLQFILNQSNLKSGDKIRTKITTLLDTTYKSVLDKFQSKFGREQVIYETNYDIWNQKLSIDLVNIQKAFTFIFENALEGLLDKTRDSSYKIQISSEFNTKNKVLKISVTDNGIGIPNTVLPNIFKPFFTTKNGHNGLGLNTAKEIIEKIHSGKIEIISSNGSYTTVIVELPVLDFKEDSEQNDSDQNDLEKDKGPEQNNLEQNNSEKHEDSEKDSENLDTSEKVSGESYDLLDE